MKRSGIRLLSGLLCLVLALVPARAVDKSADRGDVDANGQINAADALLVLQQSVKLTALPSHRRPAADVNADGALNAADALLILQHSVRLIDRFPAETAGRLELPYTGRRLCALSQEGSVVTGFRTVYQTAYGCDGRFHLEADAVLAYCADKTWARDSARYVGWQKAGVPVIAMIQAGGAGADAEFFREHPAEADDPEMAYGDVFALEDFISYKGEILDILCGYGPAAVCVEEPHWRKRGGRSRAFQAVYRQTYGEDWQDPDLSAEARWKVSRLKGMLLERFIRTLARQVKERWPQVKFYVATHATVGYNQWDHVDDITAYAAMPEVDGLIGQSWSDPQINVYPYGGTLRRQVYEQGYLAYAGFAALARPDWELFTLADPKIDTPADYTWEDFAAWYRAALVAQLMQPAVQRFEPSIWPERCLGAADTPADYQTAQLAVLAALRQASGQPFTRWAGTPGLSVGMSDSLTWQQGFMAAVNSNAGFCGLTVPLIERGIPLTVTALDALRSPADLAGVEVLILSYDCQKPTDAAVNNAVADWVRAGGTLLLAGGHDGYETVADSWWRQAGFASPLTHLLDCLGLDVTVGELEGLGEVTAVPGPARDRLAVFDGALLVGAVQQYTAAFAGQGVPVLEVDGQTVGFTAEVGRGRVVAVGLPSALLTATVSGPDQMRALAALACDLACREYTECACTVVRRGGLVAAHGTADSPEATLLQGRFVDLFDPTLPILTARAVAPGESALLWDVGDRQTPGVPRVAFAAGELSDAPAEEAARTQMTLRLPTGLTGCVRVLKNGRTLTAARVERDGRTLAGLTLADDPASDSLLLRYTAADDRPVTLTLNWE